MGSDPGEAGPRITRKQGTGSGPRAQQRRSASVRGSFQTSQGLMLPVLLSAFYVPNSKGHPVSGCPPSTDSKRKSHLPLAQRALWTASLTLCSAAVSIIRKRMERLSLSHRAVWRGEWTESLGKERRPRGRSVCRIEPLPMCAQNPPFPPGPYSAAFFTPSSSTVVQDNPLQRNRPTAKRSR